MKKLLLLPALFTLGLTGCALDSTKPIHFPPVDTMQAKYDGPKLLISKVEFVTAVPVLLNIQTENGVLEVREGTAPAAVLTQNSNLVLQDYLNKTGRFMIAPEKLDLKNGQLNIIKTNYAEPLVLEASLVSLNDKVLGDTHVAQVFGESKSVTTSATIELTIKDAARNVIYTAEGKYRMNSADKNAPPAERIDDYVVDQALRNAVNDLARAIDQGYIVSHKR